MAKYNVSRNDLMFLLEFLTYLFNRMHQKDFFKPVLEKWELLLRGVDVDMNARFLNRLLKEVDKIKTRRLQFLCFTGRLVNNMVKYEMFYEQHKVLVVPS